MSQNLYWVRSTALAFNGDQRGSNGEACELLERCWRFAVIRTESGVRRAVFMSELLKFPERDGEGDW